MPPDARRRALLPLLAISFIGALGFSIVLPVLVYIVADFRGGAVVYGLAAAMYPLFQLLGAPLLGHLSDRHGRKRVLVVSQLGTLVSWGIFLLAFALPVKTWLQVETGWLAGFTLTGASVVVLVARALDGLTGGNVAVAQAYLADISEPARRKADYAKLALAQSLGFVIGPALAGVLAELPFGNQTPILAAVGISLAGQVVVMTGLPSDAQSAAETGHTSQTQPPARSSTRELVHRPLVRFLLLLYFVLFLSFNLFYTAFPIHGIEGLGWSPARMGWFYTVLSISLSLTQGSLMRLLAPRVADEPLIYVGAVILAGGFACFSFPADGLMFLGASLFGLGNGLMWPSFLAVLSKNAPPGQQGGVQGLGGAAGGLASVLGLLLGGFAYREFGPSTFWASTGLVLFFVLLALRLPRRPV